MIGLRREFRLVPVVMLAAMCLFALKTIGLVSEGGYVLGGPRTAHAQQASNPSWAQQMFNYPDTNPPPPPAPAEQPVGEANAKVPAGGAAKGGGSAAKAEQGAGAKPAAPGAAAKNEATDAKKSADPKKAEAEPPPSPFQTKIDLNRTNPSASERALLERLQDRRKELESRGRELDLREGLLKAAEKRLESRIGELKEIESRINGGLQKKEESEISRMKGLITMYENMKAKEAARIFDRLDIKILVEVARQINPRRMSDIMAQMTPEAAERLTVELAMHGAERPQSTADLPKIEGRPTSN